MTVPEGIRGTGLLRRSECWTEDLAQESENPDKVVH